MEYGVMTTGADVASQFNESNTQANVVITGIDTDLPLNGLTVTIAGIVHIALTGTAHILAFAKLLRQGLLGADVKVAMAIPIASAFMPNQSVSLNLINSGVGTPTVYGYSGGKTDAMPAKAGQETIQDGSVQKYGADFDYLIIPPTNFDFVMLDFADGYNDKFGAIELAALFAENNTCDADGYLGGQIVIDNTGGRFAGVSVYSSGGTLTISKVNLG